MLSRCRGACITSMVRTEVVRGGLVGLPDRIDVIAKACAVVVGDEEGISASVKGVTSVLHWRQAQDGH